MLQLKVDEDLCAWEIKSEVVRLNEFVLLSVSEKGCCTMGMKYSFERGAHIVRNRIFICEVVGVGCCYGEVQIVKLIFSKTNIKKEKGHTIEGSDLEMLTIVRFSEWQQG